MTTTATAAFLLDLAQAHPTMVLPVCAIFTAVLALPASRLF